MALNFMKEFKATSTTITTKSTTQPVSHPISDMNNRSKELPNEHRNEKNLNLANNPTGPKYREYYSKICRLFRV